MAIFKHILLSLLCLPVFCGVGSAAETTTFGLKPFATPQKVRVGYFVGTALSIPFYIAEKEGFFKELNIEIVYETFSNGPAMVEANTTWDVAASGTGGMFSGMLGYGVKVVSIVDYMDNIALFVRPGSPLAKNPKDPANWKGTTWLYPMGTTAQPVIQDVVQKVGLTMNDIKSINMDLASALTAFTGGSGDGLSVWDTIAFAAEDKGFVRISDSGKQGFLAPCGILTKDSFISQNPELLAYVYTVFYKTWEWCKANDANFQKAIAYYLESCKEEGMACNQDIARRVMEWYHCPTLQQSIDLMKKTSPDSAGLYTKRPLIQAEKDILVSFDFFMAEKKYTIQDRERILNNRLIDPAIALYVEKLLKR